MAHKYAWICAGCTVWLCASFSDEAVYEACPGVQFLGFVVSDVVRGPIWGILYPILGQPDPVTPYGVIQDFNKGLTRLKTHHQSHALLFIKFGSLLDIKRSKKTNFLTIFAVFDYC